MKHSALATTLFATLTAASLARADEPQSPPSPTAACPPQASVTTLTGADPSEAPPEVPPTREAVTVTRSLRPHRPLLLLGGGVLVASYAATAAVAFSSDTRDGSGGQSLYLPVVGPWMHLARTTEGPRDTAFVAASGVLQGLGAALTGLSLVLPERIPVATLQAGGVSIVVAGGSLGRGSAGIGAVGSF